MKSLQLVSVLLIFRRMGKSPVLSLANSRRRVVPGWWLRVWQELRVCCVLWAWFWSRKSISVEIEASAHTAQSGTTFPSGGSAGQTRPDTLRPCLDGTLQPAHQELCSVCLC